MAGDSGKMGTPYVIGNKGEELVFTLEKAEFASRYFMKEQTGFAPEGRRLVVFTYAVQNLGKTERPFSAYSFKFTVVSPDDENFECDGLHGWQAIHPDRRDVMNLSLKPAQKIHAQVAIQIHPNGPINKLIVQRGNNTPVLRYDLHTGVAPLKGAFSSNLGRDSREIGEARLNEIFELGPWNIDVMSVSDVNDSLGDWTPEGGKFVVVTLVVNNAALGQYALNGSTLLGKMVDSSNMDLQYTVLLKDDISEQYVAMLDPGAQTRVRMVFRCKTTVRPNKLTIRDQQYSQRSVSIQLGG